MIIIKKLFLIILFLFPISISSFNYKTAFFNLQKNKVPTSLIYLKDRDIYLDVEDYVLGVVAAEVPALFENEAIKAQAVASRSYALSKIKDNIVNISSTINDQVYQDNNDLFKKWQDNYNDYYEKILCAVKETKGEVISRDGKVLRTYYFSMSNGKTENSQSVFGEDTFISVESPYENNNLKNFEYELILSEKEVLDRLNLSSIEVNDIVRNDTNHIESIYISGKEYSGIELRKKLGLRSTDFSLSYNNGAYTFITRGYGHGVGMSQYGANEMAKRGSNYQEILNHYYQNTEITNI